MGEITKEAMLTYIYLYLCIYMHTCTKDALFLVADGEFKAVRGGPAEAPTTPKPLVEAIKVSVHTLNRQLPKP